MTDTDSVQRTLGVGEENKIVISGRSLVGGSALADCYQIAINTTQPHEAVPIYAVVQTANGAIIQKTLRGKMVLRNSTAPVNFIESCGFIVPNETAGMSEEEKIKAVRKQSALTYEIRTVGEILASEEVTEEIMLSWDGSVLDIERFDSNFLIWCKENNKDAPLPVTGKPGWRYFTMKVMPYSSESFLFFDIGLNYSEIANMDKLNSYVLVEKYNQ